MRMAAADVALPDRRARRGVGRADGDHVVEAAAAQEARRGTGRSCSRRSDRLSRPRANTGDDACAARSCSPWQRATVGLHAALDRRSSTPMRPPAARALRRGAARRQRVRQRRRDRRPAAPGRQDEGGLRRPRGRLPAMLKDVRRRRLLEHARRATAGSSPPTCRRVLGVDAAARSAATSRSSPRPALLQRVHGGAAAALADRPDLPRAASATTSLGKEVTSRVTCRCCGTRPGRPSRRRARRRSSSPSSSRRPSRHFVTHSVARRRRAGAAARASTSAERRAASTQPRSPSTRVTAAHDRTTRRPSRRRPAAPRGRREHLPRARRRARCPPCATPARARTTSSRSASCEVARPRAMAHRTTLTQAHGRDRRPEQRGPASCHGTERQGAGRRAAATPSPPPSAAEHGASGVLQRPRPCRGPGVAPAPRPEPQREDEPDARRERQRPERRARARRVAQPPSRRAPPRTAARPPAWRAGNHSPASAGAANAATRHLRGAHRQRERAACSASRRSGTTRAPSRSRRERHSSQAAERTAARAPAPSAAGRRRGRATAPTSRGARSR